MDWNETEQRYKRSAAYERMTEWERQQFLAHAKTGYWIRYRAVWWVLGLILLIAVMNWIT